MGFELSESELTKYLVQRVDKIEENLSDRIEKIDTKVDELLKFKYQVIGGSVFLSMIITGTFQLVVYLTK